MDEPGHSAPAASHFSLRHVLKSEWPYLLVLVLALFGIAFTSYQRGPMAAYWIVLAPLIGAICVASRWREMTKIATSACISSGSRSCTGRRCWWRCT